MAFRLRNVSLAYGEHSVLDGIDLDIEEGSIQVILGPSGCGKSSLLNIVAGLRRPDSGGREGFDGLRFSFAFQEPRLLPWLDARRNALFALSGSGLQRPEAEARVERFLAAAGLAEAAGRRPAELSGGMRQRLSLVRAFAFPAPFLLLDEAFQAVDLGTKVELMDVFLRLMAEERRTALCVTHDVEEAVYLADRVVVLGPRPARLREAFDILVPRSERSLGSPATMEAEARLYALALDRGYESPASGGLSRPRAD